MLTSLDYIDAILYGFAELLGVSGGLQGYEGQPGNQGGGNNNNNNNGNGLKGYEGQPGNQGG